MHTIAAPGAAPNSGGILMTHHAAKRDHWARRAVVAGALPVAIAAAFTGTAHAQDTGSANVPALPTMPQVQLPPLYNPMDLNERPLNFLRPGYAPTPEQRIADYTDTGQLAGAYAGSLVGMFGTLIPVAGIGMAIALTSGPAGPALAAPLAGGMLAATGVGTIAGGSVGAELGGQAGAELARQQNTPAAGSLS